MKAANAKSNKIHHDRVFPAVNAIFLILLMFVTLYPVLNTVAYSFNDGTDALRGNIGLWPRVFSLESYKSILSDKAVYQAAWISGSKTVLITLLNLFWTSMLAYCLSRKEFVLRRFITVIMVLTMYVNAGLIPNYLLISKTLQACRKHWWNQRESTEPGISGYSGRSSSRSANRFLPLSPFSSRSAAGTAGLTPICTAEARKNSTAFSTC